jgi:hypothetical protein
VLQEIIAE